MKEKYKVAKYIRLSLADGDKRESESVENQRDLLDDYINKMNEFSEVYEYVDDGYTGGNFNRPGFQKMLKDIENGKINCVITKDLSRFGREHIDTGYYLERYFPIMNIRFIAINDCVDTIRCDGMQFLSFKLSFNDYYIQDISNKIKSVKYKKTLLGEHTGGLAPYGYKRDTEIKNHLVIDENVAPIIKNIFEMYVYDKMTAKEIATELSCRKILIPSAYMNLNFGKIANNTAWQRTGVLHILRNMTYVGNAVGGKKERVSPKNKKDRRIRREKHIVVENKHDPIIDKELWELAQERLNDFTYNNAKKHDYSLKGLVYCGKCGCKANFRTIKRVIDGKVKWKYVQVVCNRKIKDCNSRTLNEKKLLESVLQAIKKEITKINYTNLVLKQMAESALKDNDKNRKDITDSLKKYELKLENTKNKISSLYEDKLARNITMEIFQIEYQKLNNEKSEIEQKIRNIKEKKVSLDERLMKNRELVKIGKKFLKMNEPDNETLKKLVKKITFYDKEIIVELNFENVSNKKVIVEREVAHT